MRRRQPDYQVTPYPPIRRWMAAAFHAVRSRSMMHGLIEVDVTRARARLRAHRATTGESLSFTAFLIDCLARAVDEHKEVQALRLGSRRLVVFDDVDVWTMVEHDVAGRKQVVPAIVRVANRKTVRQIHHEIRTAQARDLTGGSRRMRVPPAALIGPYFWLFSLIGRMRPRMWKNSVGTVGITAVGMFGDGAGWGIPIPTPVLMVTVGGIGERPDGVDGRGAREYLSLTISFDHDIIDGAPAARFTRRLKELIESGHGLDDCTTESPETAAPQQVQR